MSTKILITGGCGFIGKALAYSLISKGFEVVILDKNIGRNESLTRGAKMIVGDVCSQSVWESLPPCDYVFHLAAPSSVVMFEADMDECIRTTLLGLMYAFAWSHKNGIKKLIYPSSGSIFGRNSTKCSEESIPDPVNLYGKTKLTCEYIAKIYTDRVPSLGLRIFAGYGPQEDNKGDIASVVTLFLNNILANDSPIIYGDGRQARDFVYIDDIVEAMGKTMNNDLVGVLNIGSGESVSFNKVVSLLNKLLHKNVKPRYLSKPNGYLDRTACDPNVLRQILGREPLSLVEGLTIYLRSIGEIT